MRLLTKEELNNEKAKLVREFKNSLFVYPTDTIYGIGCNALKKEGFSFVGSTICYALLQASGVVNDHLVHCFRYKELIYC